MPKPFQATDYREMTDKDGRPTGMYTFYDAEGRSLKATGDAAKAKLREMEGGEGGGPERDTLRQRAMESQGREDDKMRAAEDDLRAQAARDEARRRVGDQAMADAQREALDRERGYQPPTPMPMTEEQNRLADTADRGVRQGSTTVEHIRPEHQRVEDKDKEYQRARDIAERATGRRPRMGTTTVERVRPGGRSAMLPPHRRR